jgi:hypothetical protein
MEGIISKDEVYKDVVFRAKFLEKLLNTHEWILKHWNMNFNNIHGGPKISLLDDHEIAKFRSVIKEVIEEKKVEAFSQIILSLVGIVGRIWNSIGPENQEILKNVDITWFLTADIEDMKNRQKLKDELLLIVSTIYNGIHWKDSKTPDAEFWSTMIRYAAYIRNCMLVFMEEGKAVMKALSVVKGKQVES